MAPFVSLLQAIRRTIDKKTVEVYQLFNEELNLVKKEFNTKTVDLPPMYPHYAGSAAWARMLKRRIDRPMNVRTCRLRTVPPFVTAHTYYTAHLRIFGFLKEFAH